MLRGNCIATNAFDTCYKVLGQSIEFWMMHRRYKLCLLVAVDLGLTSDVCFRDEKGHLWKMSVARSWMRASILYRQSCENAPCVTAMPPRHSSFLNSSDITTYFRKKDLRQIRHWYSRERVCVRTWRLRCSERPKLLLQTWHDSGFSLPALSAIDHG